MLSSQQACEMARALAGVTEKDHFGSDAFVANNRIFATVWHDRNEVNLMLNLEQQSHYLAIDGEGFAEIDNAWGRAGATKVQLSFVDKKDFSAALKEAWVHSATRRVSIKSDRTKKTVAQTVLRARPTPKKLAKR